MSKQDHARDREEKENIVLYIKKTANATCPTKYGVEFQCVELIRRFFSIHKGITFPDVIDATDFFKRIDEFTNVANPSHAAVKVETCAYPFTRPASYYLRPGSVLFWKYKKTDYPYGHVAIIWKSNAHETVIIQQNLNPPIKTYNTDELFAKMNSRASKFAGVKILPADIISGVQNIECEIKRL